jgi:hypothetical protein
MLTTLSEIAGMMLAAVATVTQCLQTCGMDSISDLWDRDACSAQCKLLSVHEKIPDHVTYKNSFSFYLRVSYILRNTMLTQSTFNVFLL